MTDDGLGVEVVWDVPLLEGYDHKFFDDWSPLGGAETPLRFNPGMAKPLLRGDVDVLWTHGYEALTNWFLIAIARQQGIPIVLRGEAMAGTADFPPKRVLLRKLFARVDAFGTIGTKNERLYRNLGIESDRLFHAPYTVNNEFFRDRREELPDTATLKAESDIPTDRPAVLFVGKFLERKRPRLLLEAFLDGTNPGEATLVLVGDGKLRDDLERRVACSGCEDDIYFAGFVNQSELPRYYELADVFVLPSVTERWGLVVNEAMNFELPIVTTTAVGSAADLVDQSNGRVVPPDDEAALREAVTDLVRASPDERMALGAVSLDRISQWGIPAAADGIVDAVRYAADTPS